VKKKEKPRRLTLHRETIQVLSNPSLLDRARGGLVEEIVMGATTQERICPDLTAGIAG
jgi:hypothetical protein